MIQLSLRLTGTRALLMHHGRLADRENELTKRLSMLARQPQTEAVRDERVKLEWLGGLYTDGRGAVALTEDQILGAGIDGARYIKREREMRAAVLGTLPFFPLEYDGPKDVQQLYATGRHSDRRGVRTSRGRIMRTRPRFDEWSVGAPLLVDETVLDPREVVTAFEYAGRLCGLGDFRPRFGRFSVELI